MKKISSLLLLFACMQHVNCQEKVKRGEAFYLLDENFKGTTTEKARYFMHTVKIADTCWQFDTYHLFGPMISSEQFKDEAGSEANGFFYYYNKKGTLDSSGKYNSGFQNGEWYYFNDTGKVVMKKDYSMGGVILKEDYLKDKGDQTDTSAKHIEIESDFNGGIQGWIYYLTKNLRYPERAMNSDVQGKVVVIFIIDTNGRVLEPVIRTSVEYSLDQEALRLVKESPAWSPATIDGKKVKAYKLQPITFRLTTN